MSAPNRGAVQRVARKVKRHLLCIFIAFGAGAGATWYYSGPVFGLLLAPAGGELSPHGGLPIFTAPTDMLTATINLSMMGGAVAAFPVLLVGGFRLLSPFLNRRQRRIAAAVLPAALLCFLGGVAFAYFVMLPTGLKFLLHFGEGIAVPVITITEYMSLVTAMLFWLGVVFELPPIMFLLAKLRIVTHQQFRRLRRYVPAAAFILSIFITPTVDVVNQAMVAVPIIVLFEVGLFLAWLARSKKERHNMKVYPVSEDKLDSLSLFNTISTFCFGVMGACISTVVGFWWARDSESARANAFADAGIFVGIVVGIVATLAGGWALFGRWSTVRKLKKEPRSQT